MEEFGREEHKEGGGRWATQEYVTRTNND